MCFEDAGGEECEVLYAGQCDGVKGREWKGNAALNKYITAVNNQSGGQTGGLHISPVADNLNM